jgi:hypothetical protein
MARARKFLALLDYLEALAPAQDAVRFTFAQLEALLGAPLPPSALLRTYWTSRTLAHYNWEFSGFGAKLDRAGPAVVFTRQARRPA